MQVSAYQVHANIQTLTPSMHNIQLDSISCRGIFGEVFLHTIDAKVFNELYELVAL